MDEGYKLADVIRSEQLGHNFGGFADQSREHVLLAEIEHWQCAIELERQSVRVDEPKNGPQRSSLRVHFAYLNMMRKASGSPSGTGTSDGFGMPPSPINIALKTSDAAIISPDSAGIRTGMVYKLLG